MVIIEDFYKADKTDYAIATASGVLTAALDNILVGEFSLANAHKWGSDTANEIVKLVAGKDDLKEAISYLEGKAELPGDKLTSKFGGPNYHHLKDFEHHPTVVGLIFSLVAQLTGYGCGTDTRGKFVSYKLPEGVRGKNFADRIYKGTYIWALHMISDFAGSKNNPGKGTGIPGPILSFFKEISSIPGIRSMAGVDKTGEYNLSKIATQLFEGAYFEEKDEDCKVIKDTVVRFDLRTEMGIAHEVSKQMIPVVVNECIVRAFYSIRRFALEVKNKEISSLEDLKKLNPKVYLPYNSISLTHMLTVSTVTFTAIDGTSAAIKAGLKNQGIKDTFILDTLLNVNFVGLLRCGLSVGSEVKIGVANRNADLENDKMLNSCEIIKDTISKVRENETVSIFANVTKGVATCVKGGNPIVLASVVYKEVSTSMLEYREAVQARIVAEQHSKEAVEVIELLRTDMKLAAESYLEGHLEAFNAGCDMMDKAVANNDVDGFINGNSTIQNILGYDAQFKTFEEFDELMLSDDVFKL